VQSWDELQFVSSVTVVTNALARDPIADFVKSINATDLQLLDVESTRTVNQSMDGRALKLRFFLNGLCEDPIIDSRLKKILMLPQFNDGRLSLFQSDEIRSRYLSRFNQSNTKLCEKYNLEPFSSHPVESSGIFKPLDGCEFYECLRDIAEIDEKITWRILNASHCSISSENLSISQLNKKDQIRYLTKALSKEEIKNKDLSIKKLKEARQTLNQKSRRVLQSLEESGVTIVPRNQNTK